MTVDRVARGMTRGRPKAGFTERVMAPIHGRPRPGFTARVMQQLDEEPVAQAAPSVAQAFRPAFRIAFVLAPAAVLLVAGVVLFARSGTLQFPTAPPAPRLTRMTHSAPIVLPMPPIEDRRIPGGPRVRTAAQLPQVAEALPEPPPIYTIAALEGPVDIGLKPIGPDAPVIAPLEGPAPLKINEIKEKS